MQTVQIVLFVVVAALAVTLLGHTLRSQLSRRRAPAPAKETPAAPPEPPRPVVTAGVICPACRREYPLGLKYCPHDARALVPAGDSGVRAPAGGGVICPACKRSFDASKKFCPYDAEELMPLALASGGAGALALPRMILGKICPHCAQRYESDATFCGRDGSELVSVN